MTTSGSTNFNLTSRQVVKRAIGLILSQRVSPKEADMDDGLEALNLLLKSWSAKSHLWLMAEGSVTLLTSTASYALGSSVRRVSQVRRRTSSQDVELEPLSRSEYFAIVNKTATGYPVNWWFDPLMSARTLYVWPVPTSGVASTTTLPYTYYRAIEDSDALDNDPDIPPEWLEALVWNLAVALMPTFKATDPVVIARAKDLVDGLDSSDSEMASVFFQPRGRWGH